MEYRIKYLKYKNKYIKLKTKNQFGGANIILKIPAGDTNNITISFDVRYDDEATKFYVIISNFNIKYNNTDINLLYKSFIINSKFFIDKLNIASDQKKLNNLGSRSLNKFSFENCEENKLAENNYEIVYNKITEKIKVGIPNHHKDAKKYIESYYRKNICIHVENSSLQKSDISYYHNIMKLYIELAIIHNYNKIELNKHKELNIAGADIDKINKKYFEIYKNIPKYIESDIDLTKINLFVNGENKDISGKKIVFDSGNSNFTLIKKEMLIHLGIYLSDETINPKYNNIVFQNFIILQTVGVNDKDKDTHINPKKSNLIMLSLQFTDKKLINDKTYNIFCFVMDELPVDILLGQNTMQQLYEDGYSIKWRKSDQVNDKKIYIKEYLDFESNFQKFNTKKYEHLTPKMQDFIAKNIKNFLTGKYFEITGMTIDRINLFKENIKIFFKELEKNTSNLNSFFNIYYKYFDFDNEKNAIDLIVKDIFA